MTLTIVYNVNTSKQLNKSSNITLITTASMFWCVAYQKYKQLRSQPCEVNEDSKTWLSHLKLAGCKKEAVYAGHSTIREQKLRFAKVVTNLENSRNFFKYSIIYTLLVY